jgi:ketosteroid isomerase-like protein
VKYLLLRAVTLCLACWTFSANAGAAPDFAGLRQQWTASLHGKHLDDALALYEEQATFFKPDGSHADGKPAIRALYQTVMRSYDSSLVFHSLRTQVSGTLAYDSGDYEETLVRRDGGNSSALRGAYLMVLHRGKDERWRIVQQMWSAQAP